jgi:hypothetical protein
MRITAALVIFLVSFSGMPSRAAPCDFNGNDFIDINDIGVMVNYLNHVAPFDTLTEYWPLGDCDCDSAHLTVADLISLNNRLIYGEEYSRGRRLTSSLDSLNMPDLPASPGQMLSVPVYLASSDSIKGFQIYIRFDPSMLQYIGLSAVDSLGSGSTPYIIDGGIGQYFVLPRKMILRQNVAWANFRVNPDLVPPQMTFILFSDNSNHAIYSGLARVDLDAIPPDSVITFVRPVRRTSRITIEEQGVDSGLPDEIEIKLLSYPNPFNASVTIEYSLNEETAVQLDIFDVTGKTVMSAPQEIQSAGYHRLFWHADGFSSGLYFARLRTPVESKAIKLILQK